MNFYVKVTLGVVVIIGAALAFIFMQSDPEAEALKELVAKLIERAKARDVDGCMAAVHEDYDYHGRSYEDVRRTAETYIGRQKYKKIEIEDLEAEVTGDSARARFTAKLTIEELGMRITRSVEVVFHFRKIDGVWKITGYEASGDRF